MLRFRKKDGNTLKRSEDIADVKAKWLETLSDLNTCSQKGLVEMFDSSIGAGSVLMPYGGKYQMTETQSMVAKVPVANGKTNTVTMMSYGFDPYVSSWSPYHGAVYAVLESIARIVATGGDYSKIRFTFQEYFRRMTEDPKRWSQPFAALLGAYDAQLSLACLPSAEKTVCPVRLMILMFRRHWFPSQWMWQKNRMSLHRNLKRQEINWYGFMFQGMRMIFRNTRRSWISMQDSMQMFWLRRWFPAYALDRHGIAAAVSKMAFGNKMGVKIEHNVDVRDLFSPYFGDLICEVEAGKVSELSRLIP